MTQRDPYEEKLRHFMEAHQIEAEHLCFEESCHSVAEAARAAQTTPDALIKSICMIDGDGKLIVAIVKGEDRVSAARVGAALGTPSPRMATPEEMLVRTGYPCGGTPPFGFAATFLVDPRVFELEMLYAGGGSERALIRITPQELQRVNGALISPIKK